MPSRRALFLAVLHGGLAATTLLAATAGRAQVADDNGPGLRSDAPASTWPRWQTRLGIATGSFDAGSPAGRSYASSLSLFGDYYFVQQGLASSGYGGGFRATGGLIVGPRSMPWSALAWGPSSLGSGVSVQQRSFSLSNPALPGEAGDGTGLPYVGIGYTGLGSLRATGGGWGFSADVGLVALQPRSVVRLGQQGLTDFGRELQLSPLLQLGARYSF